MESIARLQTACGDTTHNIEGGVAVVSQMRPAIDSRHTGSAKAMRPKLHDSSTAESFARGVMDSWRVGKRGCDNGFLLFVSKEDRSFAIAVVSTAEPYSAVAFSNDAALVVPAYQDRHA